MRASLAFAAALLSVACVAQSPTLNYGIVIDAGSTGSRFHLYAWNSTDGPILPSNLSIPVEQVDDTYAVKPGISSAGGLAALQALLDYVKTNTSLSGMKSVWPSIPIFLKATAGMRVLPKPQSDAIMVSVRTILAASGFLWQNAEQARVISGEEEGVFGWISVNFVQGRLVPGHIHALTNTLGAMDLGGASTQITFLPTDPDFLANLFNLQLGQQVNENLYTHSFLYFGQNEAIRRINQLLMLEATGFQPSRGLLAGAVANPCYNLGFLFNYTDSYSQQTVLFNGTGNTTACLAVVNEIMDKDEICLTDPSPEASARSFATRARARRARSLSAATPLPPINPGAPSTCSIGGVYQPSLDNVSFVAFSSFSYLWQFLALPYTGSSPADLLAATNTFCALSWADALQKYPSTPTSYLQSYCVTGTFAFSLFTTGYGFPPNTRAISVADPDGDFTYDWALGSMLYDANAAYLVR